MSHFGTGSAELHIRLDDVLHLTIHGGGTYACRERGTDLAAEDVSRLRLLIDTGLQLASASNFEAIARVALQAGLELSGAMWGLFVCVPSGDDRAGLPEILVYVPEGQESDVSGRFPGVSLVFGTGGRLQLVRSSNLGADVRFQEIKELRAYAEPDGRDTHASPSSVVSYMAAPVRGASGELLGILQYGHPSEGVFVAEDEGPISTIAAQAAVAIENVRLTERLSRQVAEADAVRAEQRTTSSRLANALQAAGMGTWTWDAITDLIDFDERAAELFDVTAHVPVSRESLRQLLVHSEDLAFAPADLREVGRVGGQYSTEYRLALPNGEQRWVAVRGNATVDAGGDMLGMIGTVQDITPRRAQEEALRTSEKLAATGRMAATIAHEINNPLEAVTNLIYLAKTDPETPEAVSRMLEIADNELARVSQIAQQTLGFYRDTTRPVTIDVNELLNAVVGLFDRKLTGKGLQCTLDLEPGLSVVGLQGEIRQVVANLLVNAIDASPDRGGSIRIRGRHRRRSEGQGVAVLICDEGEGIPVDVQGRLFTPFVTTKASTGTGLGLWVTRGMVEKHGGSVRFRTRTVPPSGTVFRVFLPQSGKPALFDVPSTLAIQ